VLQVLGVGWYVALCLLGGIMGGLWLDNHFNSRPVLTLVGLVGGSALAFYGMYRMVAPLVRREDDDTKDGGS
jgi:Putative F0F1-ATPase subunit Ca2+/Mg2+ transporter